MRPNTHNQKPERQPPKPQPHPRRRNLTHLPSQIPVAHKILRHHARQNLAHVDHTCNRETRRTDTNKHRGPQILARQLLCHEAVDIGGVNHERDQEADALEDPPRDNDVQGADAVDVGGEDGGVWSDDKEWIGRKDPNGGHLGDCEGLRGPSSRSC